MLHYVLFKLKPELTVDAMEMLYRETYARLGETMLEVLGTSFLRNCIVRDSNMDVMITVRLRSRAALAGYLQHPLHLKFIEGTCDYVVQRVSFDWSEEEDQMINGILLNTADNVVTVTQDISPGETVVYSDGGALLEVVAAQAVPQFHKISTADIARGADVIKYGERIGYATQDIARGSHVHTQNMDNQ